MLAAQIPAPAILVVSRCWACFFSFLFAIVRLRRANARHLSPFRSPSLPAAAATLTFPWPLIPEHLANLNGRHNPEIVFQTEMVGRKIPLLAPAGRREEERELVLTVPKRQFSSLQPELAHVH